MYEGGQLGASFSDAVVFANIVVENVVMEFVSQVVYFNIPVLSLPFRVLTGVLGYVRLELLFTGLELYVWI